MAADMVQIDRAYLEEISGGDVEFEKELVQTFFDAGTELLDSYRRAVGAGDAAAATHASHTLKGSSRSIGANPFSNVCEAAEKAARAGDIAKCAELVPDLEESYSVLEESAKLFLAEAA